MWGSSGNKPGFSGCPHFCVMGNPSDDWLVEHRAALQAAGAGILPFSDQIDANLVELDMMCCQWWWRRIPPQLSAKPYRCLIHRVVRRRRWEAGRPQSHERLLTGTYLLRSSLGTVVESLGQFYGLSAHRDLQLWHLDFQASPCHTHQCPVSFTPFKPWWDFF